eukprot:7297781-Prymnesium_polylepis.1
MRGGTCSASCLNDTAATAWGHRLDDLVRRAAAWYKQERNTRRREAYFHAHGLCDNSTAPCQFLQTGNRFVIARLLVSLAYVGQSAEVGVWKGDNSMYVHCGSNVAVGGGSVSYRMLMSRVRCGCVAGST